MSTFKKNLLQFTHYGMGSGDDELGKLLAINYLKTISEKDDLPSFITFYNEGVRLICAGSPALEILKVLEEKGVKLIACKTCLKHFDLMDKVETGIVGTMVEIVEIQRMVDKVINL